MLTEGDHRLRSGARGHLRRGGDPGQDRRRPLARKVSLRSTDGAVDVSAIARAHGGGGHQRAAGFGTDLPYPELVEFLRAEIAAQRRNAFTELAGAGAVLLVDKPAGVTSHDVVARLRRRVDAKGGHAGTLDPFATGLLIVLLGRPATREQRRFMELREDLQGDGALRGRLEHRRPGGRDRRDRGRPAGELDAADRRASASARRPSRRSSSAASAPTAGRDAASSSRCPSATSPSTASTASAATPSGRSSRSSVPSGTYVRSLIADLGDAYCERLRRTAIGPFSVEEADEARPIPIADALARL